MAGVPSRNVARPERVVGLCPGTARRHREILQRSRRTREPEMKREQNIGKMCRTRTVTLDRLRRRLRRQDKANRRSLAPFGRKGLSAHWFLQVFAGSKQRGARCAGAALRTFPMNFNLPSDGARNVRQGGAPLFLRHHAR